MTVRPLKSAARAAASPMRNYLNSHFEMLKDEIRQQRPPAPDHEAAWARIGELENQLAEISLHHAQLLARVRDSLDETNVRIAELERLVERMADVVAALTVERT